MFPRKLVQPLQTEIRTCSSSCFKCFANIGSLKISLIYRPPKNSFFKFCLIHSGKLCTQISESLFTCIKVLTKSFTISDFMCRGNKMIFSGERSGVLFTFIFPDIKHSLEAIIFRYSVNLYKDCFIHT